jgi:acetyltransferase-like isoleucine patch superfamily enzyme
MGVSVTLQSGRSDCLGLLTCLDRFLTKVSRAETPFLRRVKRLAKAILFPTVPSLPAFLRPCLRALYEAHFAVIVGYNFICNLLYRYPLFQARCASVGRNVSIDRMPYVTGPVEIYIGNNVWMGGNISIASATFLEQPPRLVIQDHAEVSWNVNFAVNREIVIEEYARVSFNCRIADSDGHPRQADLRAANAPLSPRDIRPVRICRHAWIGNGVHIMKGVTIGEGAVIGSNSVVIHDIPPYCLALGNPAEVLMHNYGRPRESPGVEPDRPTQ